MRTAIYLLAYEGTPCRDTNDGVGGAMVNAWVVADSPCSADERARRSLRLAGWIVGEPDEVTTPHRPDLTGIAAARYDQATIDGEVFSIHSYPDVR